MLDFVIVYFKMRVTPFLRPEAETLIYILALLCSCWICTESAATLLRRPNQVLGLRLARNRQQGGGSSSSHGWRARTARRRRRPCWRLTAAARRRRCRGEPARSQTATTCGLTARDHWRPQTRRVLCTTTPWRDYFAIT